MLTTHPIGRPLVTLLSLMLLLTVPWTVRAQITDDPRNIALPDLTKPDPNRALIIKVQFDSPTIVVLQNVSVANTRAAGAVGEPDQILIELLDRQGLVIDQRYAANPLWIYHWDAVTGIETSIVANSGPATFYVPLSETLASVRLTDIELAQQLITIDVSEAVETYCKSTAQTPICALFLSGFESAAD